MFRSRFQYSLERRSARSSCPLIAQTRSLILAIRPAIKLFFALWYQGLTIEKYEKPSRNLPGFRSVRRFTGRNLCAIQQRQLRNGPRKCNRSLRRSDQRRHRGNSNPVSHYDQTSRPTTRGNFEFDNVPFNNYHPTAAARDSRAGRRTLTFDPVCLWNSRYSLMIGTDSTV